MMKYSQVCWIDKEGFPIRLVVIHHEVGVPEKELIEWYSKKYYFPIEMLMISICPVPIIECPLLAPGEDGQ